MTPVLLFVPSTFLTITGLSNFCNLNLCFAIIFLFINISVMPLSKSAFTITPSYVSTFSTPMFSHTFLNILNILLTSLYLFSFFAMLLGTSVHIPLYCTFLSIGHAATSQFYHSFFFSILYSGHKISLLSCSNTFPPIASFLPHSIYCTLVISCHKSPWLWPKICIYRMIDKRIELVVSQTSFRL